MRNKLNACALVVVACIVSIGERQTLSLITIAHYRNILEIWFLVAIFCIVSLKFLLNLIVVSSRGITAYQFAQETCNEQLRSENHHC